MRNKKQKFIGILLIALILLFPITNVYAYNIQVTKINLTDAFNTYAKGYSGSYIKEDGTPGIIMIDPSKTIEVTDTQLIDSNDEDNIYYIDYSLKDKTTFSIKTEINEETKLETLTNISDLLKEPILGILGVSIVQGMSVANAWEYKLDIDMDIIPFNMDDGYMMSYLNNELIIQTGDVEKTFKQDEFNVSELVTFLFKDKKVIRDEQHGIYTYTVEVTQNTSDNYVIEAILEINQDADFSKVATLNNLDNNSNNLNNSNNDNNDEDIKINEKLNNNSSSNNVVSSSNSSKDNTISEKTLPKTGKEMILVMFVLVISIMAIIGFIKIKQYDDIK